MARHDVTVDMPPRPLRREDVTFTVKRDGAVLGTLTVSNGSIVWFPKGARSGYKMGWKRLDEMLQQYAIKEERR